MFRWNFARNSMALRICCALWVQPSAFSSASLSERIISSVRLGWPDAMPVRDGVPMVTGIES